MLNIVLKKMEPYKKHLPEGRWLMLIWEKIIALDGYGVLLAVIYMNMTWKLKHARPLGEN
ncbi:MAG: hypothetical protein WC749_02245 [Dehalococcoidia bacterium]